MVLEERREREREGDVKNDKEGKRKKVKSSKLKVCFRPN